MAQHIAAFAAAASSITSSVAAAASDLLSEHAEASRAAARRAEALADDALPWETASEPKTILVPVTRERILALSASDAVFRTPPPRLGPAFTFDFESHVGTILRLLKEDTALAALHSKLAPKVREEDFWRNYFYRAARVREDVGMSSRHYTTVPDSLDEKPQSSTESEGSGVLVDALEAEVQAELEADEFDLGAEGIDEDELEAEIQREIGG